MKLILNEKLCVEVEERRINLGNNSVRTMGSIQRLKQKSKNMHGAALGPLHTCYGCWLGIFVGLLKVEMSLTLLTGLGTLLYLLG